MKIDVARKSANIPESRGHFVFSSSGRFGRRKAKYSEYGILTIFLTGCRFRLFPKSHIKLDLKEVKCSQYGDF